MSSIMRPVSMISKLVPSVQIYPSQLELQCWHLLTEQNRLSHYAAAKLMLAVLLEAPVALKEFLVLILDSKYCWQAPYKSTTASVYFSIPLTMSRMQA